MSNQSRSRTIVMNEIRRWSFADHSRAVIKMGNRYFQKEFCGDKKLIKESPNMFVWIVK